MLRLKDILFHSKIGLIIFLEATISVAVSLLLAFGFAKIATEVLDKDIQVVDIFLSQIIYSLRTPFLTKIMIFITNFGAGYTIVALLLFVLFLIFRHHQKEAIIFIILMIMGIGINLGLKSNISRPRPAIAPLISENTYSFPSAHAMNSFVFYFALCFYIYHFTGNKKISFIFVLVAILLVLMIGFSRVYLGVHYPSDVLAGYLIGFFWLTVIYVIEKTLQFYNLYTQKNEKIY